MEAATDALRVALRVLTELNEHREPAEADAEALRHLASNKNLPIDEMACEVINTAIHVRQGMRSKTTSASS